MNIEMVSKILEAYRDGKLTLEQAVDKLKIFPYEDLNFAKIDHHRATRQGFPQVIYCEGKTVEQVVAIMQRLAALDRKSVV